MSGGTYYRISEMTQGLRFFNWCFFSVFLKKKSHNNCYLSILLSIRLMPTCTLIEISKRRMQVYCLIAFTPSNWLPTRIILKVWYDCLPLIEQTEQLYTIKNQIIHEI